MFPIIAWTLIYDITVAASILLLGSPSTILGQLTAKSLLLLFVDWRFLLGAALAVGARFMFIVINNLASKHDALSSAHLSIAALASMTSIITVLIANHFILGDQFRPLQLVGVGIVLIGFVFIFK